MSDEWLQMSIDGQSLPAILADKQQADGGYIPPGEVEADNQIIPTESEAQKQRRKRADVRAFTIRGFCEAYSISRSKAYELLAAGNPDHDHLRDRQRPEPLKRRPGLAGADRLPKIGHDDGKDDQRDGHVGILELGEDRNGGRRQANAHGPLDRAGQQENRHGS